MPQQHPPLRVILAAAFGGIALLAALATSLLAGHAARSRLQANLLTGLDAHASRVAERLDRDMAARWRDVALAAGLPAMRAPEATPAMRRDFLRQLHDTHGDYALLAFVAPDGRVVADSRQLLEGEDASGNPVVQEALRRPVVGDVHDAALPASRLGEAGPLRLVELGAPVLAADGRLLGAIAAQLDWRKATEAIGAKRPGEPEILVLARGGEVVLGPPALLGQRLGGSAAPGPAAPGLAAPDPATPNAAAPNLVAPKTSAPLRGLADFPDGAGFLAATQPTQGWREHPGLGWVVLARRPAAQALAPAAALQRDIMLYGLVGATLAAVFGWFLAAWFATPLHRLAEAATRLQRDRLRDGLPPGSGYAEAVTLARAFDALLGDCRTSEVALRTSEQRLRLAQRAGQIGAYDWDIAADTIQVTREYAVLHGLPAPDGDEVWTQAYARWQTSLHPDERPRLEERMARILTEAGPYALEYRIVLPDGRTRWLADRGELMAGPDGHAARAIGAIRDVTGRRAAEDALREGEARLRLAQEAGGIGSWEVDLATGRQVWSARQFALFGLDPARPAPDLVAWLAMLHPDDRTAIQASRSAALASESGVFTAEFRIHRGTDGAERWIATSGRVVRDPSGRPLRMLGVNRDTTEAREREARLRAREAELRAMLEANPIGVLRGDIHGRVIEANDAWLRLTGCDRAALAAGGLRWDALTPPEWLPADAAAIAEARAKGACTPYEKEYCRPDGSRVPVLVGFALIGAAREGTIAFILDLTDRKHAEAALLRDKAGLETRVAERTAELAAREEELRHIYDRTPAAFHSVDTEGRLIRVSGEWLDFLGYGREEVLGRQTGEFMLPESAARWDQALAELKASGDEVREVEYRMRRHDGRIVDVLVRARAEHDAEGRFLSSYSVLFDLTERNRAEARLREAQKLEALGRIAGGVAHDFNNLLQVMTGALRLLEGGQGDPERVHRYTRVALQAAERGAGLTRRMLAFARQDQLQSGPVDLAELLQGLEPLLHGPLGSGIRREVALPPGLPPVKADRMQLDFVLFNLALNARDAMPQGGVLRFDAAPEVVRPGGPEANPQDPAQAVIQDAVQGSAQGLAPGRYVRIRVTDTGLGMDAATLARATEPFFTTKDVGKGTGLGLSMAHGFAVQSGGALRLDSTPGHGTAVTLWLPQAEAPAPAAKAPPDVALPVPSLPLALLMVEDEAPLRGVLATALRDSGFVVTEAAEAASALEALRRGDRFDVVLTDLSMPGMTGTALAGRIRTDWPRLPVAILTGNAEAAPILPPADVVVLHKPIEPAALAARLRAMAAAAAAA